MLSAMLEEIFHIQPWTPKVRDAAGKLTQSIKAVAPELEVLFMGAAALGLPGKNDIDLDILCNVSDVPIYTEKLSSILGKPQSSTVAVAAWSFDFDGFETDIMLSDPAISHVSWQRKRFDVLRSNPELLAAYKKLKESCDGLPYAEYEQRKKAFLEEKVFSRHT